MYYFMTYDQLDTFLRSIGLNISISSTYDKALIWVLANLYQLVLIIFILSLLYKLLCRIFRFLF